MKINDSVYGEELINEKVLVDLIKSKPVQRLKGLSQYGVPDEYYHKKSYSRYDHSIGVLILLRKLRADLEEQIAGLLHDVSHFAFSHVVDWVIGDPTKEDCQDNNHLKFIKNSEVRNILDNYGFDYNKISNIQNFHLLEREIPSLCADRIDYCLRELQKDGYLFDVYISSLFTHNGQIVFRNRNIAEKFANEFLRLQYSHWASKDAKCRYLILSRILERALDKGIIHMGDFYMTDYEVIDKLKSSDDVFIINNLSLLRNGLFIEEVNEGGILLKKKFRYIDPEVLFDGEIKKLSEISASYLEFLVKAKEKSKSEMMINFRRS